MALQPLNINVLGTELSSKRNEVVGTEQNDGEAVRVAIHVRPLVDQELIEGCSSCLSIAGNEVKSTSNHRFTFDHVFGGAGGKDSSRLYQDCVLPLVEGLFKGFNATILAYGQTGSGKTYTMLGNSFYPGLQQRQQQEGQHVGVIPSVMRTLFQKVEEGRGAFHYSIRVGFVEIYKEEIRDLMLPESSSNAASSSSRPPVVIREVPGSGVCLSGATEVEVQTLEEMAACLDRGSLARATSCTGMNSRSSRSHAIFTITLEQRRKGCDSEDPGVSPATDDGGAMEADFPSPTGPSPRSEGSPPPDDYLCAKIHLVDLAGSERTKRTKAEGLRLQEGIHINKGLLALGNVISALGDEERRRQGGHVPYRDSKLTRLLQDSLGGNSRTVMVACVSPADINLEETLNTLKYANRARNIKNTPQVNRDPGAAELASLRQQLARAKGELAELKAQMGGPGGSLSLVGSILQTELLQAMEARAKALEVEVERLQAELALASRHLVEAQVERDAFRLKFQELVDRHGLPPPSEHADPSLPAPLQMEDDRKDILRSYLERICELETENRALKGTAHVTGIFQSTKSLALGLSTTPLRSKGPAPVAGEAMDEDGSSEEEDEEVRAVRSELETAMAGVGSSAEEQAFLIEQRRLGSQIDDLDRVLRLKEEQMRRVGQVAGLKALYDEKLGEVEAERRALNEERTRLILALQALEKSTDERLKSQQASYRSRIVELEERLKLLTRKARGVGELEKLKARTEQTCQRLQAEILQIKQQKVQLQKQMETAARQFIELRRVQEKELLQLKREGQRSHLEVERLRALQVKQQQVLKRKTEEAEAARRRLKEVTGRNANLANRPGSAAAATAAGRAVGSDGAIELQPNPFAPLLRDDKQRKEWLERELLALLTWQDMQQVLDAEMAERSEMGRRLQEVRKRITALDRRLMNPAAPSDLADQRALLIQEERALDERVGQLTSSIAELQKDLSKCRGDVSEDAGRMKAGDIRRWSGIRNPAEARTMLKILFSIAATDREQCRTLESTVQDLKDQLEFLQEDHRVQLEVLQQQLAAVQREKAAAEAAAAAALAEAREMVSTQALQPQGGPSPARSYRSPHRPLEPTAASLPSLASVDDLEVEQLVQEAQRQLRRLESGAAVTPEMGPEEAPSHFAALNPSPLPAAHLPSPAPTEPFHPDQAVRMQSPHAGREGEEDRESDGMDSEEDDESESEEDLWDPLNPTPARGGRRSRASRAAGQRASTRATTSDAAMEAYERPVLDAINMERGEGSTPLRKLTVNALKAFLTGKTMDGAVWRAGKKDRGTMIADCREFLGLPRDLGQGSVGGGEGAYAMSPEVAHIQSHGADDDSMSMVDSPPPYSQRDARNDQSTSAGVTAKPSLPPRTFVRGGSVEVAAAVEEFSQKAARFRDKSEQARQSHDSLSRRFEMASLLRRSGSHGLGAQREESPSSTPADKLAPTPSVPPSRILHAYPSASLPGLGPGPAVSGTPVPQEHAHLRTPGTLKAQDMTARATAGLTCTPQPFSNVGVLDMGM